jgi:DGQHR domain-containing protein
MPTTQMKDAHLKIEVREIVENCRLDGLIVDREVQINITGDKDATGNLLTEKEIDVVAKFAYGGKKVLLFFECEDSVSAAGVKVHYKQYNADVKAIFDNRSNINVLKSTDNQLQNRHFKDVDMIRVCFAYGDNFPESAYQVCVREARPHSFLVWNHLAATYYRKMSSILTSWTKYELFKDFGLDLEGTSTFTINAMEMNQKSKTMYVGRMHPGQLLRIAYVVRRASEKTYAYQRMLSKDRINAIGEFIASSDPQSFLPNAVIAVFDADPKVQSVLKYDSAKHELTVPMMYCSAWIIDGQHRANGFLGTIYEEWSTGKFEPFDLPVILFSKLPDVVQTQTFININYYQKKIKTGFLCDLMALTKNLQNKLTWPSLLGRELNQVAHSPLLNRVKVSELQGGRPIGISSLVSYGLLETLLGHRPKSGLYLGPLAAFAPFDRSAPFDSADNQKAFNKQLQLLIRFLRGVQTNTKTVDPAADPWQNTGGYSLLKPTGINALFMVLAKILQKYPTAGLDFDKFLKPVRTVSFKNDYVAKKGGGWKGFRAFANTILRRLNRGKSKKNRIPLYGQKEKV